MKRFTLIVVFVLLACSTQTTTDAWQSVPLTDVRTNETFTIGELERPVLVESFAVWCPLCTKQQRHMNELDVGTHVSLNTDPNEDPAAVREHVEKHGFDYRFAVAPTNLTQQLIKEFGTRVVHAPSVPVILICNDNATQLDSGVKTSAELRTAIQDRC